MKEKRNLKNTRRQSLFYIGMIILILFLLNFVGSRLYTRFDLTKEKRYSVSEPSKKLLKNLDDIVSVQIYLDKDVNAGMLRLRKSVEDLMNEYKAYGGSNFEFEFISLLDGKTEDEKVKIIQEYSKKGIFTTNLSYKDGDVTQQKYIMPAAMITYKSRQMPVNFLEDQIGYAPEERLNNSIISLEYKFSSAISKLQLTTKPRLAFLVGQNELENIEVADITMALKEQMYDVTQLDLSKFYKVPSDISALIIAKPQGRFDEKDKYKIDQYIMNGGKVLWLRENVMADMDSLRNAQQMFWAYPTEDNLDDMMFTYGVRINQNLVQDLQMCNPIPLVTGMDGGKPQTQLFPWYYFPILLPAANNHPIIRNIDPVAGYFTSTIDTIKSSKVRKTILLTTSQYSKALLSPVRIHLDMLKEEPDKSSFKQPNLACAVLLEGSFTSNYKNRMASTYVDVADTVKELKFLDHSKETKMIVISDGDIIKNDLQVGGGFWPLGYYNVTGQTLANKTFILNCVEYLTDESGLITTRSKEIKVRLLDKVKIKEEKLKWQLINTIIPIVSVILFGLVYTYLRRKRYTGKGQQNQTSK
jgi:ABC-2 type transport system permease protein